MAADQADVELYSNRLSILYILLVRPTARARASAAGCEPCPRALGVAQVGDAIINAVAPTLPRAPTKVEAILTLFAQLFVRALIMLLVVTLIMGTPRWRDTSAVDAMLDFRGALGLGMFSLFACLLLRL